MNKTENWTKVIVQYNEETGECGLQFATETGETTGIVVIAHSELWKMGQVMIAVADKSQGWGNTESKNVSF